MKKVITFALYEIIDKYNIIFVLTFKYYNLSLESNSGIIQQHGYRT